MLFKKEAICPFSLEDGIVIDFIEGRFVFVLKDTVWTDHEILALQRKKMNISFVYERVCAIFLLENVDSIDTSDASFDIHQCDEANILLEKDIFDIEIYLINKEQMICGARSISLDKQMSKVIKDNLQKQMDTPYDDAGFDRALAKIQDRYEPFEMEEMALAKISV